MPENKIRRMDDAEMDSLDEVDRKILSSAIMGVDITEMFSPERVNKVARKFGLVPGSSFDLTDGWDFTKSDHRMKAWAKVRSESPYLIIGSPPCTMFSILQEMNKEINKNKPEWLAKFEETKQKAIEHIEFCCNLYRYQVRKGLHFLHEHPWSARSWALPSIQELLDHPMVELVPGHMCRFGMESHIDKRQGELGPVKKPTGFMSSSRFVCRELEKKCEGGHTHVPLVGGRASAASIYPLELCEAI